MLAVILCSTVVNMFQRLLDADEFFMGAEEEEEEENRFAMFRPTQTQHNNIPGIYYIIYI